MEGSVIYEACVRSILPLAGDFQKERVGSGWCLEEIQWILTNGQTL